MELRAGYKKTELGALPSEWETRALGGYARFRTGPFGSALHKSDYTDEGIPVINPMHIVDNGLSPSETMTVTESAARALADFRVRESDILIGRRGDMGRCAVVGQGQAGWLCGTGSMIVRCGEGLVPSFLQRVLSSPTAIAAIESASVGSTMVNLNQGTLSALLVPVPPLPEQRAIAIALGDVDALLAALDRLIAKNRDLKRAAMQQLITRQTRLHGFQGAWDVQELNSAVLFHNSGIYKSQKYYGHGCNIVGVSDIYGIDMVDGQSFAAVPLSSQERTKHTLQCNDLLYGESSLVREGIARTVYVTERGAGTAFAWHTRRYSIDQRKLLSSYLYYYLQSLPARAYMMSHCIQTALTGINTDAYFACPIAIPSLPEQAAIAEMLSDMDAELVALVQRRDKTRALKQGMTQELLTGRTRLV